MSFKAMRMQFYAIEIARYAVFLLPNVETTDMP